MTQVQDNRSSVRPKKTFGLEVPGYKIVELCGGGATAKVYVAIQESLGRQVALKVMLAPYSDNEERTNRFIKEGRINARLSHPNIVTIHDVGITDKYHYIAMEYMPWGNLRKRLTKRLDLDWILKVVEQIASALVYAHENGILHRDIKPENILFGDEDTAVLSDFGIATVLGSYSQTTSRYSDEACSGQYCAILGTPRYMSPDQIRSLPIGPSSDIYSLGIVLFEMLTGNKPYNGKDAVSILTAHVHDPIPTLPYASQHLQSLINKMLAKHPKDRFNNASELVNVLTCLRKEGRLPPDLNYLKASSA